MRALAAMSVAAFLTACAPGDGGAADGPAAPSPAPTSTSTTAAANTTTTTAPATTTSVLPPEPPPEPEDSVVTDPPPDPSTLPGGLLVRCDNPDGFSIAHPESWSTNPGEVVPTCGQFHPEPFTVPAGTDRRVAAITASIEPVPFPEVAAPQQDRNADRAVTTIDGLQAVRLAYQSGGDGLWPAGTPITQYLVDLSPGVDDGPGTLILDTVGIPGFDHEHNTVVLDRMARTLRVARPDVPTDRSVVARYEGGAGALAVHGEVRDGQICLRLPLDKEGQCAATPGPYQVHTVPLVDLQPVLAGVTGAHVFRVTAERSGGRSSTVLPAPVGDHDARAFAFPFDPSEVARITAYDITGREVASLAPNGR